ncbi:hypothetical protein FB45DRAFT_197967 [Roridomyces roridus]|uniref:BZIP domain-containing protein n=1 Tax=Roridomyces roridus TaxID=1738132 RepID=A0AAD7CFC3_9AGAR|nr:hypothetical protein FB45DRAFT_197967 [Roridomyces roridus]
MGYVAVPLFVIVTSILALLLLSMMSLNETAPNTLPAATATRPSRKRKSPPSDPAPIHNIHQIIANPMGPLPAGYSPFSSDFSPAGIPAQNPAEQEEQTTGDPQPAAASGRTLSSSRRAEQNRKAQRAFRERRDQHMKTLESRSALLDTALASADEANRRWEECRALVDQLRVENAALRAALTQQAQLLPAGALNNHGPLLEESEGAEEVKNGAGERPKEQ